MTDLYLAFTDEAAANAVLYEEFPLKLDEDLNVIETYLAPKYRNIDTIGVIYKPVGEPDADGVQSMAPIEGWHVNVRLVEGEDGAALEPFVVQPSTPVRVWG